MDWGFALAIAVVCLVVWSPFILAALVEARKNRPGYNLTDREVGARRMSGR
jgi:hypothetical protein